MGTESPSKTASGPATKSRRGRQPSRSLAPRLAGRVRRSGRAGQHGRVLRPRRAPANVAVLQPLGWLCNKTCNVSVCCGNVLQRRSSIHAGFRTVFRSVLPNVAACCNTTLHGLLQAYASLQRGVIPVENHFFAASFSPSFVSTH